MSYSNGQRSPIFESDSCSDDIDEARTENQFGIQPEWKEVKLMGVRKITGTCNQNYVSNIHFYGNEVTHLSTFDQALAPE